MTEMRFGFLLAAQPSSKWLAARIRFGSFYEVAVHLFGCFLMRAPPAF